MVRVGSGATTELTQSDTSLWWLVHSGVPHPLRRLSLLGAGGGEWKECVLMNMAPVTLALNVAHGGLGHTEHTTDFSLG